jgi:hypothetical protein
MCIAIIAIFANCFKTGYGCTTNCTHFNFFSFPVLPLSQMGASKKEKYENLL